MHEFVRSNVILEIIPFFVHEVILDVVYVPGVIKDGSIIGCDSWEEFMGCAKGFCKLQKGRGDVTVKCKCCIQHVSTVVLTYNVSCLDEDAEKVVSLGNMVIGSGIE
jgi:hypothetical protein